MYSSVFCKCVWIYYYLFSVAIILCETDVNLEYGIWGNKNLCICFVVTCSSRTYYLILTELYFTTINIVENMTRGVMVK